MKLTTREWKGIWISDPEYRLKSPSSPVPVMFRRVFDASPGVSSLRIFVTAMGIFDVCLDGRRIGDAYFSPGFTDYRSHLQYDVYEVASLPPGRHKLTFTVAGGWAVGRTAHIANTNRFSSALTAKRQALLCDIVIRCADGRTETIGSDASFQVTRDGPCRFADFYDGETYDARIDPALLPWRQAAPERLRVHPVLCERYGPPVTAHEHFAPVCWHRSPSGEWIADFGQNLAGVVRFTLTAHDGQELIIRHAEALENGELSTKSLRSAAQTVRYICREGRQSFSPRFTYMGFRYIGITGAEKEAIDIEAVALYSDIPSIGSFHCSDERIERLQDNIVWGGKSNFVDIPTDCPQRDERQGWTGDIALFAPTACFAFDMGPFLTKWLLDMKTEQGRLGSIPFVVPSRRGVTPSITTSCWGDSCITVPYDLYMSRGDMGVLRMMYPVMKKYLADVKRWASLSLFLYGSPYILKLPFQFGDWCAPYGGVTDWLKKGAPTGTAFFARSCDRMARIARALGKDRDARKYAALRNRIARAFRRAFTDGHGRLKNEFQSGCVLMLAFGLEKEENRPAAARHLCRLIRENGGHLSTGFTATPFLLFALADNGHEKEAYDLLMQDTPPSWLYQVKQGATTMWEQWEAVREDGKPNGGSLNHYAYGAVGDFLYRRVCGLEPVEPGWRVFRIKPVPGGGLKWAECEHTCPFGHIGVRWDITGDTFRLRAQVPDGTECRITLPDGTEYTVHSGDHEYECTLAPRAEAGDRKPYNDRGGHST